MNSISCTGVWALVVGSLTLGIASAQGGNFPIPGSGPPEISIGVAFDGARFLAGMQGNAGPFSTVTARFVDTSGQLGPQVTLAPNGSSPRVAFGGGQYLLVWGDMGTWPNNDVYGMFVQPDGSHAAAFPICVDASPKDVTGIAYAGGKFLVPYTRGNSLLARRVTLAGVVGPELTLTNSYFMGPCANNVGTDGTSYLVAWVDDIFRNEVRARVVFTGGQPGPEFTVKTSPQASNDILTVSGTPLGYLVAYADEVGGAGSGEWDLAVQAVSAAGAPVGLPHVVSSAAGQQWAPFLASDGANYLITWTDARWDTNHDGQCDPGERTCWDVYGRYLTFDGTPLGPEWPIVERNADQFVSPLAFGAGKFLMAWTEGSLQNNNGGDVYGVFLPQLPFASTYCTPKVTSLGCVPQIGFVGVPSATASDSFTVRAVNMLNRKLGLLLYTNSGRAATPFSGGVLCIAGAPKRVQGLSSGGTPAPVNDCSGVFSVDMNAFRAGGLGGRPSAFLSVPGTQVDAQFWGRDRGFPAPNNTQLSDGVEWVVGP